MKQRPDKEMVIKGLKCIVCPNRFCGNCMYFVRNENDPDTGWCDRDAIYKDALDLLNEQEPIEPYMDYDGHDVWRCGKCGNTLFYPSRAESDADAKNFIKYCSRCGKKVKWNEPIHSARMA